MTEASFARPTLRPAAVDAMCVPCPSQSCELLLSEAKLGLHWHDVLTCATPHVVQKVCHHYVGRNKQRYRHMTCCTQDESQSVKRRLHQLAELHMYALSAW